MEFLSVFGYFYQMFLQKRGTCKEQNIFKGRRERRKVGKKER